MYFLEKKMSVSIKICNSQKMLELANTCYRASLHHLMGSNKDFSNFEKFKNMKIEHGVGEDGNVLFIAVFQDSIVGTAYAEARQDGSCYVERVSVLPMFDWKNIGSMLHKACIAWARLWECDHIFTEYYIGDSFRESAAQAAGYAKTTNFFDVEKGERPWRRCEMNL